MPSLPLFQESVPTVEWLFLDLNSYFASVEQQERPELRGRPVGIVPLITEHTVCIAASYEAKAYGIKTGTNVEDAKVLCPHVELVEARPKLYVEYHHRITEAVQRCIPISNVMSIDEMACRLIGRERFVPNASMIAYDVKHALRGVGSTLRCSVGLAPNRYLAKIAADVCKPDGLFAVLLGDLPCALYCLELADLVGVGDAMQQRLLKHGVTTVSHLCSLSAKEMRGIWNSVLGERLWHWLRGTDFHDPEFKRKTLGKQHVLAPEFRTREKGYKVALKLLHTVGTKLRDLNCWAGGIGTVAHFLQKRPARREGGLIEVPPWQAYKRIYECRDTSVLQKHLEQLWQKCPAEDPLSVGVWLFNLIPDELHTLSMFESDEKKFQLCKTMDEINRRWGQQTVYFGAVHDVRRAAPTRISFSCSGIPDLLEF
jgi:DNA polymerase-4